MEHFRSILWQELQLTVGSVQVLSLAIHRHLPETTSLGSHKHAFDQFLLYLTGHGVQTIQKKNHQITAGTLVAIPAGIVHSFHRTGLRPALCLVIDFKIKSSCKPSPSVKELSSLELADIRHIISSMVHVKESAGLPWEIRRAILTLHVVETMLDASAWFPSRKGVFRSPIIQKVETILKSPDSNGLSPSQIAAAAGYQKDYLNRVIKQQTGLTLGQWKARERVARAKVQLKKRVKIADAAEACGFSDQNYFARWFRQQTGLSPSQWLQLPAAETNV